MGRWVYTEEPEKEKFADKIIVFLSYVIVIAQLIGVAVVSLLMLYFLYNFLK
jgi:hypothetical protein